MKNINVEFTEIKREEKKGIWVIPSEIKSLKKLKSLDLARTNARSSYLPEMFQALTNLTQLNLEGAIIGYNDYPKNNKEPRKELFETLKHVPQLTNLSLSANNITSQEGELLLSSKANFPAFPAILYLNLENNNIFGSYKEQLSFLSIIEKFFDHPQRQKKPQSINLLNNGKVGNHNIKIHELTQILLDKNDETLDDLTKEIEGFNPYQDK